MASKLLTAMLLFAHICEGALIRKSTAHNFLHKIRQRRGLECSPGGCSAEVSEAGELAEVEEGNKSPRHVILTRLDGEGITLTESLSLMQNGATANKDTITKPTEEAEVFEGSGLEPKQKPALF